MWSQLSFSFRQPERRTGTYIACTYELSSIEVFKAWMDSVRIPNPLATEKYHTTILYSRKELQKADQIDWSHDDLAKLGWKFQGEEFEVFDSTSPGKKALVMVLDAPELYQLHEDLRKKGATHDYPYYVPHITLSYDLPPSFDWKRLNPPPIFFVPKKIYSEPLDLGWAE